MNRSLGQLSLVRIATLGLLAFLTASEASAQTCTLKSTDREWIEYTLGLWRTVERDSLKLEPGPLPWIVLFDENCVWHVNPDLSTSTAKLEEHSIKTKLKVERKFVNVFGTKHEGSITLPDQQQIPAQLTTFAAPYSDGKESFLVSAMPVIWQKAPHLKAEVNLNILIRSVFVHEMTHTRHQKFFERLNQIEKQHALSGSLDDDIIQNRFSKNDPFRTAFESERDLLYESVVETDRLKRRQKAKNALDAIRARRRQFFVGNDAIYEEVEDIFLTMEGAANWAAYRSAIAEGISETDAIKLIRRGGRRWSQDEGLALFLLADSFLPGWQKKVFGKSEIHLIELLQGGIARQTQTRNPYLYYRPFTHRYTGAHYLVRVYNMRVHVLLLSSFYTLRLISRTFVTISSWWTGGSPTIGLG